jgi:AraC family transcriptional activator of tynA and feaB
MDRLDGQYLSTENQRPTDRLPWLNDVIGKHYTHVEVAQYNHVDLFNEMNIYPWHYGVSLSLIKSNALQLQRLHHEPDNASHDCYFAVLLLSGAYQLQQAGREVNLLPNEMTLYDATEPHQIIMPKSSSKVIISIPRSQLEQQIVNPSTVTAKKIPSSNGIGLLSSMLIRQSIQQLDVINPTQFTEMTDPVLDMLTLALKQLTRGSVNLRSHHAATLMRIKQAVKQHSDDSQLTAESIAQRVGLSVRYINNVFNKENSSLMRYVTDHRLSVTRKRLANPSLGHLTITELAYASGFNNTSHFSRVFKHKFGLSPRQFRVQELSIYK